MAAGGGHMGSASLADLIIAVAYFLIPLEIAIFMVKRRYYWVVERRCWAVSFLFIAFILLCGITHLFAMLHVPPPLGTGVKWATAVVSAATSVTLFWVIPEALSLPQYVRDIMMENKLMKDFRGIMTAMRRELREDAIIDNARHKLRRVLPANTFIDISTDPVPPDFLRTPREVLSLPINGPLSMHLRRANLNEAQVTWLHDICIQMKQALQQAAYLQLDQQYHAAAGLHPPPMPSLSLSAAASSSSSYAASMDSSKAPLGHALLPNHQNNHPHAFSSQSSFVSASATPDNNYPPLPPPPPPPAPTGFARAPSSAFTASRGGAPVAVGGMGLGMGMGMAAAGAAAAMDVVPYASEREEVVVERALLAELELTKVRMRSAGVLSRLQALLDVLETTELTAEQRRCVALLRDGARLDVLDQPKAWPHEEQACQ